MKRSLALMTTVLIAGVAHAASPEPSAATRTLFTNKGEASFVLSKTPGMPGDTMTLTETRYLELRYPAPYLLKAKITRTSYTEGEGEMGSADLELRADGRTRFSDVLWSAQVDASEVKFVGDEFVGAVQFGCCGAQDTTRLFNLKSGQKIEAALGRIITLKIPNSPLNARYLSLALDSRAPKQFQGKSYIGTFSYFSNEKIIARARIYADIPPGWGTELLDLQIADSSKKPHDENEVSLWNSDGKEDAVKAFTGFSLQATASYASQVEHVSIAIKGDAIDETASHGSTGLAIQIVQ